MPSPYESGHVNRVRLPPILGAIASVTYAVLVVIPYLVVPSNRAGALGAYYGFGPLGPPFLALVALVGAIAFAGGATGRTDPSTAAGASIAAAVVVVAFSVVWAVSVDLGALPVVPVDWIDLHRFVVPVVAAIPVVAGAWYARALGLF